MALAHSRWDGGRAEYHGRSTMKEARTRPVCEAIGACRSPNGGTQSMVIDMELSRFAFHQSAVSAQRDMAQTTLSVFALLLFPFIVQSIPIDNGVVGLFFASN